MCKYNAGMRPTHQAHIVVGVEVQTTLVIRSRLFHNRPTEEKETISNLIAIIMKTKRSATQFVFVLSASLAIHGAFARISLLENSSSGQVRGAKTTSETTSRRRLPKRKSICLHLFHNNQNRILICNSEPPGPGGHSQSTSHSGYLGCLGLSDSELQSSWKLSGRAPKCQYTHHAGKGNSTSSGSSSTEDDANAENSNSGTDNETKNDSDQVVSNGNFDNVNGDGGSEENVDNGGNSENGGNANNGENGGNANNGENGGNANNGENADNNDGQDGKNSGNNNGQNQGQNDFDPYGDFDITKCDTYENLWLWDLSLTCDKEGDPSTCECIFAEEMMELGSLTCEDAMTCPRNCQICSRCMKLLGCQVPRSSTSFLGSSRNFFFIAVALGLSVFAAAYYTRRRRRRGPSILQKQLLDDNYSVSDGSSDGGRVWLAPVASTHDPEEASVYSYNNAAQLPIWVPPRRHGKDQKPVWLAPDASSEQLASTIDTEEKKETSIWLAPDASSEQLGKRSTPNGKSAVKKDSPVPGSPSKQLKEQSVEHEKRNENNEKPLNDSALFDKASVDSKDSEEAEEEVSLNAWSVEADDPSISGIPCAESNASAKLSQALEAKTETNAMNSPETDDNNLPALT